LQHGAGAAGRVGQRCAVKPGGAAHVGEAGRQIVLTTVAGSGTVPTLLNLIV
jgi:hypothetical protein